MNNSSSPASSDNILLKNCRNDWPHEVCEFANVCGLISTAIWFLVLLPQVLRNFVHKSVEGLSLGWAIINFTAALNNLFFVYFYGNLPLYSKISADYMPVLEAILLLQFFLFTKKSKKKFIITGFCGLIWIGIIVAQSTGKVYNVMEWVSITLWSIETFPQVKIKPFKFYISSVPVSNFVNTVVL